jgi:hypothetical protein
VIVTAFRMRLHGALQELEWSSYYLNICQKRHRGLSSSSRSCTEIWTSNLSNTEVVPIWQQRSMTFTFNVQRAGKEGSIAFFISLTNFCDVDMTNPPPPRSHLAYFLRSTKWYVCSHKQHLAEKRTLFLNI